MARSPLSLLTCCLLASPAAAEATFEWLGTGWIGTPPADSWHRAVAASEDGCSVAGEFGDPGSWRAVVRWQDAAPEVVWQGSGYGTVDLSGDGTALLGTWSDGPALWREEGTTRPDLAGSPMAAALSRDGSVAVGQVRAPDGSLAAVRWDAWQPTLLLPPVYDPAGSLTGSATDVSADGSVVVGWSGSPPERLATRWVEGVAMALPALPGATDSAAYGVSSDGTTVVGSSGGRAVRWQESAPLDLGPGIAVASDPSGSRILVQDGSQSWSVWEASTGLRPLVDVLASDFGVDVSDWLGLGTASMSADGSTFVGTARVAGISWTLPWRARRGEERCPGPEWMTLLGAPLEGVPMPLWIDTYAVSPGGWVYVSDQSSAEIWRTRLREGSGTPPSEPELLVDLGAPSVFLAGTGPDDEAYVSTVDPAVTQRIDLDGSANPVIEGASFPPIDDWCGVDPDTGEPIACPVSTLAYDLAFAPDATAFVAAGARALRVGADGVVTELFDVDQAESWTGPADGWKWLLAVERAEDGRLFWSFYRWILVTDASGTLLEVIDPSGWLWSQIEDLEVDAQGRLWIGGQDAIGYLDADGNPAPVVEAWAPLPDGTVPISFRGGFDSDAAGNLYFAARLDDFETFRIYRRQADGALKRLYEGPSPHGQTFHLAAEALLTTRPNADGQPELIQIPLPAIACDDGLDSDGDGLVDLDDPGCLSALDTSERSPDLVCDNGLDDDGDGLVDFPDDPGCARGDWRLENPACSDGIDNDRDGAADWNGAAGLPADPECTGDPARLFEQGFCGLGYELGALAVGLRVLGRRLRRRRG